MTSARHSVVQGYLHCLTVHFCFCFPGGQVSRGVVLNFLALLQSLDRLTNTVFSRAAQTRCHSIAPWRRAGAGPVLLLGTCRVKVHPSYEEHNFSTAAISSRQRVMVLCPYAFPWGRGTAPGIVVGQGMHRLLFRVAVYCSICKCIQSMG